MILFSRSSRKENDHLASNKGSTIIAQQWWPVSAHVMAVVNSANFINVCHATGIALEQVGKESLIVI